LHCDIVDEPGRVTRSHESRTPLLDLDPDLGRLLARERVAEARSALGVRVALIRRGPWDAPALATAQPGHLGLLLLEGVVARGVLLADTTSIELMGGGDVLRPWHRDDGASLSRHEIRWTALTDARLALLDRHFAARLPHFPEVNAVIVERLLDRTHRLALTQAISQVNGVDRRLVALFWHLAERWGRVTPNGIAVPLTLSHRELGQLVGARRPTISTALGELARRGELIRRADGSWLLSGEPSGVPTQEVRRIIDHRRRLLPAPNASNGHAVVDRHELTVVALRERLITAREQDVARRESNADERDRVADERDRIADERERLANQRDDRSRQREREPLGRARRNGERHHAASG
jgi:CRP-like cAMP-binding protein